MIDIIHIHFLKKIILPVSDLQIWPPYDGIIPQVQILEFLIPSQLSRKSLSSSERTKMWLEFKEQK